MGLHLLFSFTWYPYPEGGAVAFTFGGDTDVAVAALDDILTDRETETSTLHKVVQLNESFEHACLLLLGDASTCIEAVDRKSVGLAAAVECHTTIPMVTYLDKSFMGVLHGVSDEVREYLLHTSFVKYGWTCGVGIVFDELNARFLYSLGECLADVVEDR